mmetsp:Transcript_13250/g.49139  ORF Transcript_13250/g.49139 Transcript_13250/m.49139 type:complete len:274 (+) Transcript_13250:1533-2354(+)
MLDDQPGVADPRAPREVDHHVQREVDRGEDDEEAPEVDQVLEQLPRLVEDRATVPLPVLREAHLGLQLRQAVQGQEQRNQRENREDVLEGHDHHVPQQVARQLQPPANQVAERVAPLANVDAEGTSHVHERRVHLLLHPLQGGLALHGDGGPLEEQREVRVGHLQVVLRRERPVEDAGAGVEEAVADAPFAPLLVERLKVLRLAHAEAQRLFGVAGGLQVPNGLRECVEGAHVIHLFSSEPRLVDAHELAFELQVLAGANHVLREPEDLLVGR